MSFTLPFHIIKMATRLMKEFREASLSNDPDIRLSVQENLYKWTALLQGCESPTRPIQSPCVFTQRHPHPAIPRSLHAVPIEDSPGGGWPLSPATRDHLLLRCWDGAQLRHRAEERYLMPDCVFMGRPPGTPFEGGTFKVQLDVQENYPLQARPPCECRALISTG